ncbi:hypothetical protein RB213_009712 [Colletotrichum asianum]
MAERWLSARAVFILQPASWRAIEDPPPVATDLNLGLSLDLDCNLEPGLGGSRTLATGSDRRRRQPSFS